MYILHWPSERKASDVETVILEQIMYLVQSTVQVLALGSLHAMDISVPTTKLKQILRELLLRF